MPDISPVKGLIELTDNYTSQLGLAEAALGNFTKTNQESLKAVAGAAGLITAAISAITVATIELGKRGAEVNDVAASLEHFAGGAKQAQADMQALLTSTKGTVDNFTLAKDATHLLSAGVQLTAQDFGTLGQAAFLLKDRGLGPVKDQLELVSDALVTGRTRALAMSLGVIDTGNAQEDYARKLGVTVDQLSLAGKAEANRIAVMTLLRAAVKESGETERNFADEFQYANAKMQNWIDSLGSAIATSQVFAAGFKAVESVVSGAFQGGSQDGIKAVVSFLEQGAIKLVGFGQIAISTARVFEGAWNGLKTIVLGLETAIVAMADSVVDDFNTIAQEGAKLHIVPPGLAADIQDTHIKLDAMTESLHQQTIEAAKAVFGHTEFDKTLDVLSTDLLKVEGAMSAASQATAANADAADIAAKNAEKLTAAQKTLTASMVDQEKLQVALNKSSGELSAIWDTYYKEVSKLSGTSRDEQVADIEATFDKNVAALDALDPLYAEKYQGYRAIADASLKGIESDWASVRDQSVEGLQQTADKALETYNLMLSNGLTFNRDVLDAQLQKYRDLQAQANGWGVQNTQAVAEVKNQVTLLDSAWDAVGKAVDDNAVKVRMLDGEVVSVAEALKRLDAGGSQDVTSANFADALKSYITAGGWNPSAQGINQYKDPYTLARAGYSFTEILQYAFKPATGPLPPPQGPRIPGFAEGGIVMVGEKGPEAVRLPFGSQVYPTGTPASGYGGGSIVQQNTFHVNGTAHDVANQIADIFINRIGLRSQFGGFR